LRDQKLIGLVPAAGHGSRLGLPFPKELFPTICENQYKPVINYVVDDLILAGIDHIIFVINELKHQLIGHLGSGIKFDCHFSYVVQQNTGDTLSTSPGLADALASAYHLIRDKVVLFGMADTIMWPKEAFKISLTKFDDDTDIMLCLFPTQHPENFGMVSVNSNGIADRIVDKPKSTNLKYMWGCIIWKPNFSEYLFDKVRNDFIGDFAKILNYAIKDGFVIRTTPFPNGRFIDFGTLEQIQQSVMDFDLCSR
jgi:glucose-1-phosphate thymidylyltransferase